MIDKMAERLRDLRMQAGLSRKQVAERIGCTVATIGTYEQGVNQPPVDVLIKLAAIYKVSTDYILGVSFDKSIDMSNLPLEQQIEITEFVRKIVDYRERQNKKTNLK